MANPGYHGGYFDWVSAAAAISARSVVHLVVDLIHPASVVDLGCARGAWLRTFQEEGVSDVLGVDGDYVDRDQLVIARHLFMPFDLEHPLYLERRFDLAVSLEVAEHLTPDAAATFVESLVRLAPTVLFSAAVPGQGGVDHRNEQWPQYWAAIFRRHGYEAVDCIRPSVWREPAVDPWYSQNMVMYVADRDLRARLCSRQSRWEMLAPLDVVHPRLFLGTHTNDDITTRELVRMLPAAIGRSVAWRLKRRTSSKDSCPPDARGGLEGKASTMRSDNK